MLLVFANAQVSWRVITVMRASKPSARPEVFPLWYAAFAFDHTRKFSGWLVLGLLLEIVLLA